MKPRSRKAFATYTAIILMLLVATTLVSVGMMFGADARRTRSQREEAQVRQLLTAGALAARNQLDHHQQPTTRPIDVAVPAELTGKLTITLTPQDSEDVTAVIHAEHGQRRMDQTIRFKRDSGMWHTLSATLESP